MAAGLRRGRRRGHEVWTAHEANLEDASDADLIAYAHSKRAILVTTNRDCAQSARRQRTARVIWLSVVEADAQFAMMRAIGWLGLPRQSLPAGRVLKVFKVAEPKVLTPE